MKETELVYVCSDSFWRYVFLSLRTLLASGSSIENVTVFVVGNAGPQWKTVDSIVSVCEVPDRSSIGTWGRYWGENKLHLARSDAKRVIYLDSDVMVLKPIECVRSQSKPDILARLGVELFMGKFFCEKSWNESLTALGCATYPYYSPGFMVFDNESHKKIEPYWAEVIHKILRKELPLPANKHAEMYAFSLAAAMAGLTHEQMDNSWHRYAMIGEGWEDAVVYHLGTPGFYRHYLPLERRLKLRNRRDVGAPRPFVTEAHALYVKCRHRLRAMLRKGPREASIEY